MNIRRATIDDAAAIARLFERSLSGSWEEASIAADLSREDRRVWISEDTALTGAAIFSIVLDEGELLWIAIAPENRGTGAGTELLRAALRRCAEAGVRSVYLEVRASNAAARALYRRCGFAEVGIRRGYYREPNEDAILLRKDD